MSTLQIGDNAPIFAAENQHNSTISLEMFKGKKVVLYFYPKDMTPGCTAEACNLRDNYDDLLAKGIVVIGVSADAVKLHQKFTETYKLPFHLIADTEKNIIKAYGAWGPKKFMGRQYEGILRKTFIIDEGGQILKIIEKVDTKNHFSQIINELNIK